MCLFGFGESGVLTIKKKGRGGGGEKRRKFEDIR